MSVENLYLKINKRVPRGLVALLGGLSALSLGLGTILANDLYLKDQKPVFFSEHGKRGFIAPGNRVQQSDFDPTIVQIVNAKSSIIDFDGLDRGRRKLIELCKNVTVYPVKGAEEYVWEAKVPDASDCLSQPSLK